MKCSLTHICKEKERVKEFAMDVGWVGIYPMQTKGQAHDASFYMFQHEDAPLSMVMDGSKELTLGKFCHKLVYSHY